MTGCSYFFFLGPRFRRSLGILGLFLALATVGMPAEQVQVGPNVNIIGGPAKIVKTPDGRFQLLEGDPGQRQNEVSCFVDSRDPLDIGCAYNDYTPVEIAGLNDDGETGDAWIGQSVSTDGGFTWRKFMFPGYKQDASPEGEASPLHGLDAAADPTWVSGPNGTSYLSAIAFNRSAIASGASGGQSNAVLFVQKYVNHNNVENDPNPFEPDGLMAFFPANSGEQFQDKPWAGVAPNGDFNLVWATFLGGPNSKPHSVIWRAVCAQGDLSRCVTTKLSEGDHVLNGTILTFHPKTGWIDISYRRRKAAQTRDTDAIMFVRCFDASTCTKPMVVASPPELQRADGSVLGALFDQGSRSGIFRNVSNPAIAADDAKRVYIAWAQRIPSTQDTLVTRDSAIMLTVGKSDKNGSISSFSTPVSVDSLTANPPENPTNLPHTRGHQIRPSLWFASGKLYLSAAFLQEDQTLGVFELQEFHDPGNPGPDGMPGTFDDGKILKYVEMKEPKGELDPSPPMPDQLGRAFTEFIYDRAPAEPILDVAPSFIKKIKRRHTEQIGLWTGTPADVATKGPALPTFTFTNVWRPRIVFRPSGMDPRVGRYEQGEHNPWGIDMFSGGDIAFAGDYDSLSTQAFIANATGTGFVPNTSPSDTTPVYVAWTDNRNVRTFTSTKFFTPAGSPLCSLSDPHAALTRNQDIFIARAGQGFYLYVLGNQKPLGNATLDGITFKIKRAFTLAFQNAINETGHYRALVVNQPTGGTASWKQFENLTEIDLSIPPFSIAARELYVSSTDPDATIRINVFKLDKAGGSPVPQAPVGFALINPDRTTPDFTAPIPTGNIDPTDPTNAEIFIPDPLSPDPLSSNVVSPDPLSPDPLSPDPLSPDPLSPDPLSPDPLSPDPLSPDPLSPDPLSPDPLSVPEGGVMTDTMVEVNNNSNTSAAIAIKTFATKDLPAGSRLQLIVTQPYFTTTQRDCKLKADNASPILATISDPTLATKVADLTFDPTDPSPKNLTVGMPPGGKFFLVYRWVDPIAADNVPFTDEFGRTHSVDPDFNPAQDLVPVTIAQAISTPDALGIEGTCGGDGQPSCPTQGDVVIPLSITTTALPDGVVGTPYPTQTFMAIGGEPASPPNPPYSWSATGLPAGLSVDATGVLTGTPTQVGTSTVVATVTDSQPFQAMRSFTLRIFPRADAGAASTAEDTAVDILLSADGGGSPLTFNFINPPDHGTLSGTGPTVTYTPAANFNGADSFAFTAAFSGLTSSPAIVSITVTAVNDAPVAANDIYGVIAGEPLMVAAPGVLANDTDVDGDAIQALLVSGPTNGTLMLNTNGSFTYTPAAGFVGNDSFMYRAGDGAAESNTALVMLNVAPKTFVVSNTNDSGAGSLRQAMLDANARGNTGVHDVIAFSIPGAGPHTIAAVSALPTISDPVIIDAPPTGDCSGVPPTVEIDGFSAGTAFGLLVNSAGAGTIIRGLAITQFGLAGIFLNGGGNNVIECSYLGLAPDGVTAKGNTEGILISGSINNTIGGTSNAVRNVISANLAVGINIGAGSTGSSVLGNFIGTNAVGNAARGNGGGGVLINAANSTIGGLTTTPGTGAGNVISGNTGDGVKITGPDGATGTLVQGNIIGLNAAGGAAIGNSSAGVRTANAGVQVGGTAAGARNVISANQISGVLLSNSGSTFATFIQGNYIGTDISGTLDRGNDTGISVGSAPGTRVGGSAPGAGNVISGNALGIFVSNISHRAIDAGGAACPSATATCYNAIVQGNVIGLNAVGTAALGNATGVSIASITPDSTAGSLVGGTVAGARNVISGNVSNGISISGATAGGNAVQGNFIGTDVSGTLDPGNGGNGVQIIDAPNNTIGGVTASARNVISGNSGEGVRIDGATATGNVVRGNYVGTTASGAAALGNSASGIYNRRAPGNSFIGNVVSGNLGFAGIAVCGFADFCGGGNVGTQGNNASGSVIQGNIVGRTADGSAALGNSGHGVSIDGAPNAAVGGTAAGAANVISANGAVGVVVFNGGATGNQIRGNSISDNVALGIDLAWNSVTANDAGDVDAGPNGLQNFPVLDSVTSVSGTTTISGTLNSTANTMFALDFFANTACDGSGHGEGAVYLGSTDVTTDGSGNASFNVSFAVGLTSGHNVTATASGPSGTSEFSACRGVTVIFTDEASFIAALSGAQSLVDFDTSATGPIAGNEFVAQGLSFDSPLAPPLGVLEIAPPDFFAASNYLNIDERPFTCCDGTNDDLIITISGNWRAIGFQIIDSAIPDPGESISVFDQAGNLIYQRTSGPTSFFGIIASVPISSVTIDEAVDDGDDVGYDKFRLGNP